MARILFIDDDLNFSPLVQEYLQTQGHEVAWHPHSDTGLQRFHHESFDLCLLDVHMPHRNGFELAAAIRTHQPEIPVIFLTGATQKEEKLRGFALGADDYITKPFSLELLNARIQAVLRRSTAKEARPVAQDFTLGQYAYQHAERRLSHATAGAVVLSAKEAALLSLFVENLGEVVQRSVVLQEVWGTDDYAKNMSLNVYISKLRKLLRHDDRIHLLNVHGEGYVLRVAD